MNLEDIDYITGDIGNPFNVPTHIKVKLKNGLHESIMFSNCDQRIKDMFYEYKHALLFNTDSLSITKTSELSSYAIELSKSIVKSHLRNVKINDIIDEKKDKNKF